MTALEKEILTGVYRLREELRKRDWQGVGIPRDRLGAWRIEIDAARLGMVAVAFSPWASGLNAAGRKRISRAYGKLEASGLIVRHGDCGRTSHISLTPEGDRVVEKLLEAVVDE